MDERKNAALEEQVQELQKKVVGLERSLFWVCVGLIVAAVGISFCFWQFRSSINAIIDFQNSVICFNEGILAANEQVIVFLEKLNDLTLRINELLEQLKLF